MKELERILELWSAAQSAGESAVLATVVKTRGSSYRLPGARLLITQGGRHAGSISGGCLEEDLLKKAWWLTEKGPVVRRYDTTPDGEISTGGFGLGCNGIIHVRLERLTPGQPPRSTSFGMCGRNAGLLRSSTFSAPMKSGSKRSNPRYVCWYMEPATTPSR